MSPSPSYTPPEWLVEVVATIPDFPKPGIQFRDLSPLWRSSSATSRCAIAMCGDVGGSSLSAIDVVVGIEARGFIVGMAVAQRLGVGFVAARKPGKLPGELIGVDYALEYGTDRVEVQADAFEAGERVLVIDDVIATGGTAAAVVTLVESAGATVAGVRAVLELDGLGGRDVINNASSNLDDEAIVALWRVS